MNILVVSSYLPYPLTSGGHIRLYNLLKQLAKNHTLTLVCEKRQFQANDDIKEVKKFCKEIFVVDRLKQWSLQTIAKTGFSAYPFLLTGHKSNKMKKIIQKLLEKEKFDLIHVETFYVMQNLPKTSLPTVLVEHNIEYLVYKRFAQFSKIALRPLFYIDVMKLSYWEKYYWKKAIKLVAVSEEEKSIMQRNDVAIVSNGVDINKFTIRSLDKKFKDKKVLFIGDFKWMQNRDAVKFILQEIWPILQREWNSESGKLILWIVGKHIPQALKEMARDSNIIFDEHAPKETEEIFKQASVLLSPVRVGGGTSYKILEAMASGVPVVTTTLGREGIKAQEDKEIVIADSAYELAEKLIKVLSNEKLYNDIATNARKLIEAQYDWKIITKELEKVYTSVVKK